MRLKLRYFASLRDAAGTDVEEIDSTDADAIEIFESAAQRHSFLLPRSRLRLAVNGEIVDWSVSLQSGDELVFLPPVSGG
jgi:molybdopterin synthase sulfur carrier subunit